MFLLFLAVKYITLVRVFSYNISAYTDYSVNVCIDLPFAFTLLVMWNLELNKYEA